MWLLFAILLFVLLIILIWQTSAGCFLMLTMENMNYCTLSKHGASCDLTRVTDTAKDW